MPIAFAGSRIDRADHIRSDPAAIEALHAEGRLLRMEGLDPVMTEEGDLAWASVADVPVEAELIFLGIDPDRDGRGCFVQVPAGSPDGMLFAGPRSWQAMSVLPPEELALYGAARALVNWHSRHRFCAVSGHPTRLDKGGWQRTCTDPACKAEHFPRTDPVTIMLVEHQGQVLLGRQPRFPAGRYSTLAGFVEPGETIEEAVTRELFEEAGVRALSVDYRMSQPWPFPHSLMIACVANVADDALTIDTNELEDAVWVDRAGVRAAMAGEPDAPFIAPPPLAIAYSLLRHWLDQPQR